MNNAHRMVLRVTLLVALAVVVSFVLVISLFRHGLFMDARAKDPEDFYPALITTAQLLAEEVDGQSLAEIRPQVEELSAEHQSRIQLLSELPEELVILPEDGPGMVLFEPGGAFFVGAEAEDGYVVVLGMRSPEPPTRILLLMLVGISLVVGGVGVVLTVPTVRRLRRLEEAAIRISDGDLDARAEIKGTHLIAVVAQRFDLMTDKLQESLLGQQALLRAVAHEIRTPIARIRFGAEMLQMAGTAEERQRRATDLAADVDELDALVTELTVLSHITSGQRELDRAPRALHPLLERERSRLSATVELDLPAGIEVYADGRSLQRVLRNLLLNASRYCEERVVVRAEPTHQGLRISVEDDGPGIPPEDRERCFEPFVRLDESRDRGTGGVGLGLALVKHILELHGGRAWVDQSPELGGARFVTVWPAES